MLQKTYSDQCCWLQVLPYAWENHQREFQSKGSFPTAPAESEIRFGFYVSRLQLKSADVGPKHGDCSRCKTQKLSS
ncbi:hypothetical protein TNIN_17221 [Trichonephila inaurata madagascariensis]|uniref:Uncharacterized protein n=1 Tax=Trichonephila inaurata madagascariensis TaxID=2747483 RepID=A0A8X7C8X4_9ARAC|nr:hypothetical protein TNIN_17221 [Trichonephila inaurata madagascariensis]